MTANSYTLFRPRDNLLRVLQTVNIEGEITEHGQVYSLQQVFCGLKYYIKERHLYDIAQPWLIRCHDDPLAEALGVKTFTLDKVLELVYQQLETVGVSNTTNCQCDSNEDVMATHSSRRRRAPATHSAGAAKRRSRLNKDYVSATSRLLGNRLLTHSSIATDDEDCGDHIDPTVNGKRLKLACDEIQCSLRCNSSCGSSSSNIDVTGENSDSCIICLSRPKDASVVHGRTGHQVTCLACAKKLWQYGLPCPVCRLPITSIIRNYVI